MTRAHSQTEAKQSFFYQPLFKTLFFGFIWAIGFAVLLPPGSIQAWQYSFLIGAVPSTLIWDWFNIQGAISVVLMALLNFVILMSPYFYYLKTQHQSGWLYLTISAYGFMNAALGFTIIISVRQFGH